MGIADTVAAGGLISAGAAVAPTPSEGADVRHHTCSDACGQVIPNAGQEAFAYDTEVRPTGAVCNGDEGQRRQFLIADDVCKVYLRTAAG